MFILAQWLIQKAFWGGAATSAALSLDPPCSRDTSFNVFVGLQVDIPQPQPFRFVEFGLDSVLKLIE
jgi:hypothetical protein